MIINPQRAEYLLTHGEIVALPTETVYGLAASIFDIQALHKIFITKERPLFDPLIVHVSNLNMAKNLTDSWNELEVFLANKFWPGPLTFIKNKNDKVNDMITASLPSVGVRCPNHPIMLQIINNINQPLAAPSANKFKSTSPTNAQHVEDEFESNVAVVDGGNCNIGIESTIIEIFQSLDLQNKRYEIKIYRPGIITKEQLSSCLSQTSWSDTQINYSASSVAPGQLKEHYRPKKPITAYLVPLNKLSNFVGTLEDGQIQALTLEITLAARQLYSHIREADLLSKKSELKLYFPLEHWLNPEWYPIRERLEKACSKIINL